MKKAFLFTVLLAGLLVTVPAVTQMYFGSSSNYRGVHDTISVGNGTVAMSISLRPQDSVDVYDKGLVIIDPNAGESALITSYRNQTEVLQIRLWGGGNFWVSVPHDCTLVDCSSADTTQIHEYYK